MVDFAPHFEAMGHAIAPYAREVFGIIVDVCSVDPLSMHSRASIAKIFTELKGQVIHNYTMDEIEIWRTGENRYFLEQQGWTGWLEGIIAEF